MIKVALAGIVCVVVGVVSGVNASPEPGQDPPKVVCVRDPNTGRWTNPHPEIDPRCRIPSSTPASPAAPAGTSSDVLISEASGEIVVMPVDGFVEDNTAPKPQPRPEIQNVVFPGGTIPLGNVIQTGPDAKVKGTLPDGHRMDLRARSRVSFEAHPGENESQTLLATLYEGIVRFAGELKDYKDCKPMRKTKWCKFELRLCCAIATVRGTDFEVASAADLSAYIKVYSGSVVVNPYDTDKEIILEDGLMLTFDTQGRVHGPVPIR